MSAPRDARRRQGVPDPRPIERRRALGLLGGLLAFALGFAVAGVLVLASQGGQPSYLVAITVGLLGIGAVGLAQRGAVALPAAIWSPITLRAAATAAGLPAWLVLVALYALAAVGVLGNLVVPLSRR